MVEHLAQTVFGNVATGIFLAINGIRKLLVVGTHGFGNGP